MTDLDKQTTAIIRKIQATLIAIESKTPVFFNVSQFKKWGLVRECGKTSKGLTNWVLTDKARGYLAVHV